MSRERWKRVREILEAALNRPPEERSDFLDRACASDRDLRAVELETFWLDKYEVTNQQFQQFVEAGGYRSPQYWKQPFAMGERTAPFEEAVGRFLDATGRVGPASWELGTFLPREEELPVRGVSWYEAAAYCEFAGKDLPTLYHWTRAAGFDIYSDILDLSNFGADGLAPVGAYQGLGPYGTYDMAGNVKEWCLNRAGASRYILGGAWNEPLYKFLDEDARPPLERGSSYGFRCAKYVTPLPERVSGFVTSMTRGFSQTTPVPENVFEIYRSL